MSGRRNIAALLIAGVLSTAAAPGFASDLGAFDEPLAGEPVGESLSGHFLVSASAVRHNEFTVALENMQALIEADPANTDLQHKALRAALNAGDTKAALELAKVLAEEKEEDAEGLAAMVLTADAFGRDALGGENGARATLGKMFDAGNFYADLARPVIQEKGETAEAFSEGLSREIPELRSDMFARDLTMVFARLALMADPDNGEALYYAADMEWEWGRSDKALGYFNAISVADPYYAGAQLKKSAILAEREDYENAETVLAALAEKQQDDPEALYMTRLAQGKLQHKQRAYERAAGYYGLAVAAAAAIETDEETIDALYNRALAFAEAGQWPRAERDLRSILDLDPDHADALNYIGYVMADKNINLDEAFEMIGRALSMNPHDPNIKDSYGWVLYRMGDYEQALNQLGRAGELNPVPEILYHYAEALEAAGHRRLARMEWNKIIDQVDRAIEDRPEDIKWADLSRQRLAETAPGVANRPAP